jgi:transposase
MAVAMDGPRQNNLPPRQDWQRRYRQLATRYNHFIQRYDEVMATMQSYRQQVGHLESELRALRPRAYHDGLKIGQLEDRIEVLVADNATLKQRLADLTDKLDHSPPPAREIPAFVKANVPSKRRQRPGRKVGHEWAHRPMPANIDAQVIVPVVLDGSGANCCPTCNTRLLNVKRHQRIVQDLTPAKVVGTCYDTISGYCLSCRKSVETRAPEQPPASDVAGVQLGVNALTTAALMRVKYRLPYRLITQLMSDLPGLPVSPGTVARQIQRMGRWLEGAYDRLRIFLRSSPAVNMDETSWRVDGHNGWLWTLLDPTHTLFHRDQSRGQKVVRELLGEAFGGVLITDFYSAYTGMDCRKQKCLVHLLRELKETAIKSPEFAGGRFRRGLKRVLKELLLLRKRKGELKAEEYQRQGQRLEDRLKALGRASWDEPHAVRIARRLRRHEKELTVFLWEEGVEATNNAAERALRPAVVMRKISGGSRSDRGARATTVLMSVIKTAQQQDRPLFETIKTLLMNAWAGKNPGLLTDALANSS